MKVKHVPVLVEDVLCWLQPKSGDVVVDLTIGYGGHAEAILKKILPGGRLVGIDQDAQAIVYCKEKFEASKAVLLFQSNYRGIEDIVKNEQIQNIKGIVMDCGVSSAQLEASDRGFSFQRSGPLDMRMDQTKGKKASELLDDLPESELARLISDYSDERFARRIARAIKNRLPEPAQSTTTDLARVIQECVPMKFRYGRIHPATRTFQALRMATNQELESLRDGLEGSYKVLSAGGRLAVIAFQSQEDRMVKHTFRGWQKEGRGIVKTKKPARPSEAEEASNPRSRSAKMRVFEKGGAV
jgi:16S rRNA (cytosine1402-N4)-methyltransferase